MSDEGDDEGRKKKIAIIVIAVILLLLIIIGIILCLYFFVLEGDDDEGKGDSTDDSLGGERKFGGVDLEAEETSDVAITWKKLNATDANANCLEGPSKSPLMYARNQTFEDEIMAIFIDKYKNQPDGDEKKNCGHEFFIGMRKAIDKEILLPNKETVPGPLMAGFGAYVSSYKTAIPAFCYNLLKKEDFKMNSVDCATNDPFVCYMCEYECKENKPFCYKTFSNKDIKTWRMANDKCKADTKGTLASVEHHSTLNEIKKQILAQEGHCSEIGIGNYFSRKYESLTGREIPFTSKKMFYPLREKKTRVMSCVVINTQKDYVLEPEDCNAEHCFICFV